MAPLIAAQLVAVWLLQRNHLYVYVVGLFTQHPLPAPSVLPTTRDPSIVGGQPLTGAAARVAADADAIVAAASVVATNAISTSRVGRPSRVRLLSDELRLMSFLPAYGIASLFRHTIIFVTRNI